MSIEKTLRAKRPRQALSADYERSRKAAIHLNCIACHGGSRGEAAACDLYECFLWPFRPGAGSNVSRPDGVIPTAAELREAHESTITDAQREAGRRLANRGGQNAE